MSLNLFSDNKYFKYDELYKKYHSQLYDFLKAHKFILSNQHYLTYSSACGNIGITIFESCCIDDSKYPERDTWHEFHPYEIEYIPYRFCFRFNEDYSDGVFNIEQMKRDYDLFNEVRDFIKDLFSKYDFECKKVKLEVINDNK